MALNHAEPGKIVDLTPPGTTLKGVRSTAIVKTDTFEVIRLVVHAGVDIKRHQVDGPITLQCLRGRALLGLPDGAVELSEGQWIYLEAGARHSLEGLEDTSLLLTIFFPLGRRNTQAAEVGTSGRKEIGSLDESLKETFPASDPTVASNPSTGIRSAFPPRLR